MKVLNSRHEEDYELIPPFQDELEHRFAIKLEQHQM